MINYLLIAAVSFWFAELSSLPQTIGLKTNFKIPVVMCSKCLGFWFGFIYSLTFLPIHISIFYGCFTSLFAIIYSRLYYKILS